MFLKFHSSVVCPGFSPGSLLIRLPEKEISGACYSDKSSKNICIHPQF